MAPAIWSTQQHSHSDTRVCVCVSVGVVCVYRSNVAIVRHEFAIQKKRTRFRLITNASGCVLGGLGVVDFVAHIRGRRMRV